MAREGYSHEYRGFSTSWGKCNHGLAGLQWAGAKNEANSDAAGQLKEFGIVKGETNLSAMTYRSGIVGLGIPGPPARLKLGEGGLALAKPLQYNVPKELLRPHSGNWTGNLEPNSV